MRATRTSWAASTVALLALASSGCNADAKRVGDHFLEAVARDDWATAHADLHPEARADTPSAEVLRARFEGGGKLPVGWFGNCGKGGELARIGYNVTSTRPTSTTTATRPVLVGVPPLRRGKCNGPLLVELAQDASLPGRPWRVRTVQWNRRRPTRRRLRRRRPSAGPRGRSRRG